MDLLLLHVNLGRRSLSFIRAHHSRQIHDLKHPPLPIPPHPSPPCFSHLTYTSPLIPPPPPFTALLHGSNQPSMATHSYAVNLSH